MHLNIVTSNPIIAEVLAEELRDVHGVSVDVVDIIEVETDAFHPADDDIVIVSEASVGRWCRWREHLSSPRRTIEVIGALSSRWLLFENPERHGFDGCIDFKVPARDLVRELDGIHHGSTTSVETSVSCASASAVASLCHDDIDRRIAAYITMGMSDRDIGSKVFLSAQTVRNRVSRMLERSHVNNRTQLAMACVANPNIMRVQRNEDVSTPRSESIVR